MQSPEVLELRSVGSDLRPDGSPNNPTSLVDECFVSRTRFYSAWYQGEIVHAAHQGIHTMKGNHYDQMLRSDVAALAPVIFEMPSKRLSGLRDVLDGVSPRLSEPIFEYNNISYHRDYKRRFEPINVQSLENPFLADIWTKPVRTIEEAYRWKMVTRDPNLTSLEKVRLLSDPSLRYLRRGRRTNEELKREREGSIRRLKRSGLTEREIAKELKMPKTAVHRALSGLDQE